MDNSWDLSIVLYSTKWTATRMAEGLTHQDIRQIESDTQRLDARVVITFADKNGSLEKCIEEIFVLLDENLYFLQNSCPDISMSLWIMSTISTERLGFEISNNVINRLSKFNMDLVFSIYRD